MKKAHEILAIIPARGNSKSILRKNIRNLGGYPLIAYSIAAARQSQRVTRVLVSTDDEEIAHIAREYGAETPFLRPDEFSQDDTQDLPVFQHALRWLKDNEQYIPDVVVQLRATSPFRPHGLVDSAIELLLAHPEADSVRGVVPSTQNPYKMWRIGDDGSMRPLLTIEDIPEAFNAPRQQLPDTFWQTGHIDAIRLRAILEKHSMSGEVILPLMIDAAFTVDIDTLLDWQRAESSLKEGRLDVVTPGRIHTALPPSVSLLVMDFDGVMTDDRVWVDGDGREMVAANRADGLGLERLRHLTDIQVLVMSRESNPVVAARCTKLNLPVLQNVKDKAAALKSLMEEKKISPAQVVYIGNDLNDLPCFPLVGFTVVPADANVELKQQAHLVLQRNGGFGAVRELCDLLIHQNHVELGGDK